MTLSMNITQVDNGWIVEYTGHDCLQKKEVFGEWAGVLVCIGEYFYEGKSPEEYYKKGRVVGEKDNDATTTSEKGGSEMPPRPQAKDLQGPAGARGRFLSGMR